MEKSEFKSREELQEFIRKHTIKCLGIGREGRCVLLDNNRVIKYLYDDYNPDFILQFKDIDSSSFVFAKEGIYVNEYIAAIYMEYIQGKTLEDSKPSNQDLKVLSSNLRTLSKDIVSISESGVLVKDFHCGNIIYDNNRFKVIDTLPYLYLPKGKYKIENLREIMNRIYAYLLDNILNYQIVREKYSYLGKLDYLEYPDYYFMELKLFLESILGEEIHSLSDAEKSLKKTLK